MIANSPTNKGDIPKGSQTRQDIIQAAHDLFINQGYHGTSMRQIAQQAGIALGGIYNHFESKGDIFREVLLDYHPYHEIIPLLAGSEYQNLEEMFRHAANLIDSTLSSQPEIINLMFIEMVEFRSQHIPELIEAIFPFIGQVLGQFTASSDEMRPIPFPMLMRSFIGMLLGYYITKQALGAQIEPEFYEDALDYFIDIFLHGILKPENLP